MHAFNVNVVKMASAAKSAYPNLEEEQTEQLVEQPRPQLPPRIANVQSSPAPYVPNQNIFAVLLKNARQISSLTAGECVRVCACVPNAFGFVCYCRELCGTIYGDTMRLPSTICTQNQMKMIHLNEK